jgi:hypothetical protein
MRLSDTTLVVSAIFQVAEEKGNKNVSPGMVTNHLEQQFKLNMPIRTVVDVMTELGITTHKVQNTRYIIWNEENMSQLKQTYIAKFNLTESDTSK